jgi:hypothetical protein
VSGPDSTSTVDINGVSTRIWREGDGPPLGFLAGFGGLPRWMPFLDRSAERRTVTVPSLPGFPGGRPGAGRAGHPPRLAPGPAPTAGRGRAGRRRPRRELRRRVARGRDGGGLPTLGEAPRPDRPLRLPRRNRPTAGRLGAEAGRARRFWPLATPASRAGCRSPRRRPCCSAANTTAPSRRPARGASRSASAARTRSAPSPAPRTWPNRAGRTRSRAPCSTG